MNLVSGFKGVHRCIESGSKVTSETTLQGRNRPEGLRDRVLKS